MSGFVLNLWAIIIFNHGKGTRKKTPKMGFTYNYSTIVKRLNYLKKEEKALRLAESPKSESEKK
jgi:hypothetical protein